MERKAIIVKTIVRRKVSQIQSFQVYKKKKKKNTNKTCTDTSECATETKKQKILEITMRRGFTKTLGREQTLQLLL